MRRYIQIGGKQFCFTFMPGTVLSLEKHSTTHVSGSGGGGSITSNSVTGVSGHISNVNISSVVVTERECWIKEDDGRETRVVFKNLDIPCRTGQRVAFVGFGSVEKFYWMSFVNFASMDVTTLMSPKELMNVYGIKNAPEPSNSSGGGVAFVLFFVLWITGVFVGDRINVSGFGIAGFILGVAASLFFYHKKSSSKKEEVVEIKQSTVDYFISEYNSSVKWAVDNMSSVSDHDSSFLTPESAWPKQTVADVERQRTELIKQRREQGVCTNCGGKLSSAAEKAVGYCDSCRTA